MAAKQQLEAWRGKGGGERKLGEQTKEKNEGCFLAASWKEDLEAGVAKEIAEAGGRVEYVQVSESGWECITHGTDNGVHVVQWVGK